MDLEDIGEEIRRGGTDDHSLTLSYSFCFIV